MPVNRYEVDFVFTEGGKNWRTSTYPHRPLLSCDLERVLDVLHPYPFAVYEHPDHVEPIRFLGTPVTVDPDVRALRELALLAMINGLDRITELSATSRFDFNECDERIALHDDVDVAAAVAKTAIHDAPPFASEPSRGDLLAKNTHALIVCGHGAEATGASSHTGIRVPRA